MSEELNPMDKFNFLLGAWELEYIIPKSEFSDNDNGKGKGEFKRSLNDQYVTFDYSAKLSTKKTAAHTIFAWDNKSEIYRFWWFEDSGEFMQAACNFISEKTLCLNWHNSILVQTFTLIENGKIILQMKSPSDQNDYHVILEVVFTKKE